MSPTVAVDTSALLLPVEADVRVFEELARLLEVPVDELDPVVPPAVVEELEGLAGGDAGETGTAAAVGADLVRERCRVVEAEEPYADDALVGLAERGAVDAVVTNDRPLRDRVLERGVRVIGLRGRDELAVTQP